MITYAKRLTTVRYLYPYIRLGPRGGDTSDSIEWVRYQSLLLELPLLICPFFPRHIFFDYLIWNVSNINISIANSFLVILIAVGSHVQRDNVAIYFLTVSNQGIIICRKNFFCRIVGYEFARD